MRRILLAAILALLMADASGVLSVAMPDTCRTESSADCTRDGCDAFCPYCSCCGARVVVTLMPTLGSVAPVAATLVLPAVHDLLEGSARKILHVPLPALA